MLMGARLHHTRYVALFQEGLSGWKRRREMDEVSRGRNHSELFDEATVVLMWPHRPKADYTCSAHAVRVRINVLPCSSTSALGQLNGSALNRELRQLSLKPMNATKVCHL